jgi:hypothetical protein
LCDGIALDPFDLVVLLIKALNVLLILVPKARDSLLKAPSRPGYCRQL